MKSGEPSVDERIQTQMQRIQAAVAARYGITPDALGDVPERARVEEAARLATVSAHWGLASNVPLIGPAIVLTQQALRRLLRWYINPIVEQQNRFNQATVRALFDLQAELDELRAQLRSTPEQSNRA